MRHRLPVAYVCLLLACAASATIRSAGASDTAANDKVEEARDATLPTKPTKPIRPLDFAKFDDTIVKDFNTAWARAKNGRDLTESVVLLFRTVTGYVSKVLPQTNEHGKSTFDLPPHTFAIFHTHPTVADPRPSANDVKIADKYKLLMFTITARGMYVYDPHTKLTTRVMAGTDWLEASKWTAELAGRMAGISPAFKTDSSQISSR